MSGMTNYVIAEPTEVPEICDHPWPLEKWPGFEGYKFFASDELGHLLGILNDGKGSYRDFPILKSGERGWVYSIPSDLVTRLLEQKPSELPKLAEAWTDRINTQMRSRWEPAALQELLEKLRELALTGRRASRAMFLWHSLAV